MDAQTRAFGFGMAAGALVACAVLGRSPLLFVVAVVLTLVAARKADLCG